MHRCTLCSRNAMTRTSGHQHAHWKTDMTLADSTSPSWKIISKGICSRVSARSGSGSLHQSKSGFPGSPFTTPWYEKEAKKPSN